MAELFCAQCGKQACLSGQREQLPKNCPGREQADICPQQVYTDEEMAMAQAAARVEAEGYGRATRVEEIMDFSYKMGYHKIGIAFCIGLTEEARVFTEVLRNNGFEVASIVCKNGGHDKQELGIADSEKCRPGQFEAMCNPIAQAQACNAATTDFNVILGLCVGHDSLFIKYSTAPVTVLAAKDRVLGHNPLAAIYGIKHYYKRLNTFIKDKYEG